MISTINRLLATKQTYVLLLLVWGFMACGTENDILKNQEVASGARVKFIHAVPGGPSVDIFANDAKLNGTTLVYGNLFPGSEYSVLQPGNVNLRVSTVASGTVTAQNILTAPVPLENDKYYTIAATGTSTAPAAVLVNDDLSIPDPSKAYYRVLNLLTTTQSVDFAVGTGASSITNVAYRTASNFVAVEPTTSASPYTLQVRQPGSTTALIGTALTAQAPAAGRKYTILVRGTIGGTGTAAPTVSVYTTK